VKKFIGRKLRPSAADLDGDSLPDMVFGSDRGGLLFYGTNTSMSTQIKVTGNTTLCPGDTAILDAGSGFDSYLWNTGEKTQQIVVSTAGSYNCVVTKGSFSYKAYISIQMHPGIVKADYTFTNNDLTVTFTALATNVDSVRWSFGDGFYSNDLNPVHAYSAPGNYSVCLEMFDNCGAKADTCKSILITGINDNSNQSILIYPNPVEKLLYISSSNKNYGQKFSVKISDVLGKEMIVRDIIMRDNQIIDIGSLSTGVYIFIISDINGEILIKTKLFKQGV
jgi:hypothetical protein